MTENPNADLFGSPEEEHEMPIEEQLWGKNPNRCSALKDLLYEDMIAVVNEAEDLPVEGKLEMVFKMTANSTMDVIMESVPIEDAADMSFCFDTYLAVSLIGKKYEVDIFTELHQALSQIKRDDFPDDDAYEARLAEFEEQWWSISQPKLDQRNPGDAIVEMLGKYGLMD
jgi:hypothetical protein